MQQVYIQETRWHGKDVWPATAGCTFLHLGRLLPEKDAVAYRGEGVEILLDNVVTEAWKQGGEVWKAVSSKIVIAKLHWAGHMHSSKHHSHKRSALNVTVYSVLCIYLCCPSRSKIKVQI